MKILGLDPSLTSTGVAVITDDLQVTTHRVESAPPKRAKGDKTPATLVERRRRIDLIVEGVIRAIPFGREPDLVVIEGPAYSAVGGSAWDRAHLWWCLVERFLGAVCPVAVSPPGVAAKWATGSGRAGKGMAAAHLARLFPTLDVSISEDEFDATALAALGAQFVGLMPTELARHREQLAKVAWPELVSA